MDISKYDYHTNKDALIYEFFSDGPKGRIKKIVKFSLQYLSDQLAFYNLTFGDWNEAEKKIDDLIISNNNDKEKILATVALTIVEFSDKHPMMPVYIQGSTSARTRVYQMGINRYFEEIENIFYVFGLFENSGWHPFIKGTNYSAFLILKK